MFLALWRSIRRAYRKPTPSVTVFPAQSLQAQSSRCLVTATGAVSLRGNSTGFTTGPAGSFAGSISLRKETYQEEVGIGEILVGRSREIIGPAKTGSREGTPVFTPTAVPRQRVVHYRLNYPCPLQLWPQPLDA